MLQIIYSDSTKLEKIMKKLFTIIMILFLLLPALSIASGKTLRCGHQVISLGDIKNQVLIKCGEPYSKEIIGYIDHVESKERIRVMKLEEWIIIIDNQHYYSLVFEGNKLIEIKSAD